MRYAGKGLGLGAAVAATCLAGTAATAAPAAAAPAQPERPHAPSTLVLSISGGEAPAPPAQRTVVLHCAPNTGGSHPAPEEACERLSAVDGDIAALVNPDDDRICPLIWDPVTISAEGFWEGREVSYERTFANSCVMEGATGVVFSF